MREHRPDRTTPVAITLLVVSFLLMTFDVRAGGEGAFGSFRAGTSRIVQPAQRLASTIVDPLADLVGNLSDIASLRADNETLRARLAAAQAELASVEDKLERLEVLERRLALTLDVTELSFTNANVVGRADSFDLTFRIDRGEDDGVLPGHPVIDENGYLVGRVLESWVGGASVVPIVADVEGVTVTVGDQIGTLTPRVGSGEMVLEVFELARPVAAGAQVVTSTFSIAFPPSLPVGEVIADTSPQGQALTAAVRPFADPARLRVVVVITWPRDPAAATADDLPPGLETTTTTTSTP
ncbi:MAG: rod shape-determining protein MreC [Acidimicrobiia bacterium]|nr:rod shape-determining protein MreC [Acidimicrobiia bacterium]